MANIDLVLPINNELLKLESTKNFYENFSNPGSRPCYLFGHNRYADSVLEYFRIDGIVDDFSPLSSIAGKTVIRSKNIPANALVLSLSGGRPLAVRDLLNRMNVEHLDYFSFRRASEYPLCPIHFNEGFEADFENNRKKYEWAYTLLADDESRRCFKKLISFRLQYDLDFLEGFADRESLQYFEPFLDLQREGESFADIGAFNGYTSEMFVSHCPEYSHIHLFEPDPQNLAKAQARLEGVERVVFHPIGLSDTAEVLRLTSDGSGSRLSDAGEIEIEVDRLDHVSDEKFTFIKMDIEGAEIEALEGAKETIKRSHPKLAVAIYHCSENSGPFWQVPEKVLSIRNDYNVYVRHYTESIYETVMFFIPKVP